MNDRLLINRVSMSYHASTQQAIDVTLRMYYERNHCSTDLFINSFMIRSPASIQPSLIPGPRIFENVPLEMT